MQYLKQTKILTIQTKMTAKNTIVLEHVKITILANFCILYLKKNCLLLAFSVPQFKYSNWCFVPMQLYNNRLKPI